MKLEEPYLIVDLNDSKIIFLVVLFDEKKNFKVLKFHFIESSGIQNGRINDIDALSRLLKIRVHLWLGRLCQPAPG